MLTFAAQATACTTSDVPSHLMYAPVVLKIIASKTLGERLDHCSERWSGPMNW